MKSKNNIFCLLVGVFVAANIFGTESTFYFEKISPDAGFAFDGVYAISEDANGFVWFGCNNGLYYSNTEYVEKITLFPDDKGISQSLTITDLLHDSSYDLWVCSYEGLFKRSTFHNSFERLTLYSKDSVYCTDDGTDNIFQFDEKYYMVVVNGTLFYFDINEGNLHEAKLEIDGLVNVSFVGKDMRGNILVGTTSGHIFRGTHPVKLFEMFYKNKGKQVSTICDDNNKYYVGYLSDGVDIINEIGEKISELTTGGEGYAKLPDNRVRDIIKTETGEMWIGTYQGIVVIRNESSSIVTNNMYNGLPHKSVYILEKGRNGGIWIGTWAGGVAYYNKGISRFNHVVKIPDEKETKSVISSFIEDKNGNIWVGSEQIGLKIYNIRNGKFETKLPKNFGNLPNRIKSMCKIDDDRIAIGTFFNGVWIYNQRLHTATRISENTPLDNTIITTITASKDELWIGQRGGRPNVYKYNIKDKRFEPYNFLRLKPEKGLLRVWKLFLDSSMKLWVCTEEGLYCKYRNDSAFKKCFDNDTVYGLNSTAFYTVYEDHDEKIWIGTKGKGLFCYDPVKDIITKIQKDTYNTGCDVFGIVEDKLGTIWFSTDNGVFQYHVKQNDFTQYTLVDGLPGNQFNPNSILRTSNGEVFFGSSNGFSYIDPSTIKHNDNAPTIVLTDLLINNQQFETIKGIEANSFIAENIKSIVLSHKQNSLTFSVTNNNFIKPHKRRYKYRLTNYDDEWVEIEQNRDITYTKIPPGDYTLEVYGSNNDNVWSVEPLRVDVKIKFPFWQKWYAFLIYLIILTLIVTIVSKEAALRLKLKKEILSERYESEAKELLYAEKMKFFTNISHELRTPLTLIISPLENLLQKFKYDQETNNRLQTIKRNSSRLLRLTNQILDYRLLEVNKLKAKYAESDIVDICNEVVQCFDLNIKEKQINMIFSSNYKELLVYIDPDMIEKIVYNLLSNAIKFSNDKGQIFLSIEYCEDEITNKDEYICTGKLIDGPRVEIKVRDFGKGIKEEMLPHIIERFSTSPYANETGTGIGLHLSQEYASLHEGNIMFTSKEGKGSTFILNIPFNEEVVLEEEPFVEQVYLEENELNNIEENNTDKEKKAVLLIAEDNDELRVYLKNYLQNYFKVVTAKNGQQAFEIAVEVLPDIVITDIMMPHTDGIELTQKLKNNNNTDRIPIIVLTALSETKYQKESLLKGVESYLTKPVDETLLLAQVKNILNKRRIIEKRYAEDSERTVDITSSGGLIVERAVRIVEQNLQNSSFDMNKLIEELNVSRSTFHRKIKTTTNQSPSEFIRDIRLKFAIKLMKSGNYNIDELGLYVGFNSTSYFIRSFKKKYGKTPNEYYKGLK